MNRAPLTSGRFRGAVYRIATTGFLLFLLIAANTFIKILRDSIFLGHHPVTELPYLYILVALLAGIVLGIYSKHTARLSIVRLILATNVIIVLSMILFWLLLTYSNAGWVHYAFYIWSAIIGVIAVAQIWILANQVFTSEEAKQAFGILAAGGTLGGVVAAFCVRWSVHASIESNHLLWCVAGLYVIASVIVIFAERRFNELMLERRRLTAETMETAHVGGIGEIIIGSRQIKTIAAVILVSVIVSTMIDFQFKASAKEAYASTAALAAFFSSYYGWLSVATLFAQVVLTGKMLNALGLVSSLYVTPGALLAGSLAIMLWPSLLAAALTRMADATLRNSIHRSGMEIVYMAFPASVVRSVKGFLDVVLERVGDASAGLIILLFSLTSLERYVTYVHFICVALIVVWFALINSLRLSYSAPKRQTWASSDVFVKTSDD